ncbi:MAG: hypothetical protein ACKO3W_13695 [bacterium]
MEQNMSGQDEGPIDNRSGDDVVRPTPLLPFEPHPTSNASTRDDDAHGVGQGSASDGERSVESQSAADRTLHGHPTNPETSILPTDVVPTNLDLSVSMPTNPETTNADRQNLQLENRPTQDIEPNDLRAQHRDSKVHDSKNFDATNLDSIGFDACAHPSERARQESQRELFELPTLHHFMSHFGVHRVLEQLVEKSLVRNRQLDHVLLHGGTGSGTTLIARALVRDLAPKNCVELDVLDGVDASTLHAAIREVRHGGVLLIRHIELLDGGGERMLMNYIGRKNALGTGRFASAPGAAGSIRSRKPRLDEVDDIRAKRKTTLRPINANFTLIATAHFTQQIGYQLRCRFDHLIHLRKDPIGTRSALCRALARKGVVIDGDAIPLMERFVETIADSAEQLGQAILSRAEIECMLNVQTTRTARGGDGVQAEMSSPRSVGNTVTRELMQSIITCDMPCRLPDEVYASALSLHLAGRRVQRVTDAEVTRINHETGWGEMAVHAALVLVLRAQQMRSTRPAA